MIPDDHETRLDLQTEIDKTESHCAPNDSTADNLENQNRGNRDKVTWDASTRKGLSDQQWLDMLADRFAKELRSGNSPAIEEYQKADKKAKEEDYSEDGRLKSSIIFRALDGKVDYSTIKLAYAFLDV